MTIQPTTTSPASNAIGKLCVCGDRACANGDFGGLRQVAHELAGYASEPVHCELVALAAACVAEPERAAALWDALKERLYREPRV